MKRMFLFTAIVLSASGAFSLGGYGSLDGDAKKVADRLIESLDIEKEDAFTIYDNYMKGYIESKDWQYSTFTNGSNGLSKITDVLNSRLLF